MLECGFDCALCTWHWFVCCCLFDSFCLFKWGHIYHSAMIQRCLPLTLQVLFWHLPHYSNKKTKTHTHKKKPKNRTTPVLPKNQNNTDVWSVFQCFLFLMSGCLWADRLCSFWRHVCHNVVFFFSHITILWIEKLGWLVTGVIFINWAQSWLRLYVKILLLSGLQQNV